jgi:aminoglycoside phosphotransferase (APT) family kinase protein
MMRDALATWLAAQFGAESIEVGEFTTPEGVGYSNETVLVDASWTDADGTPHDEALVVRLETTGDGVFPSYDLGLQVACMRQIGARSTVPVPNIRGLETDASVLGRSFFVMDRIDADVPRDGMPYTIDGWLKDAAPEEQRVLWWSSLETMAELHKLDVSAMGVDFLDRSEFGPAGLEQQFRWWESYAAWVAAGRAQPVIDAAGAWLRANLPTPTAPTGITWGDARISNMMYRDFRPVAVLDWEMASLGPAEIDFAWFLFFQRFFSEGIGFPDLPGFPSAAESATRYASLLGRDLDDLFWYEVFAAWRYASILARLAGLYAAIGKIPADTDAADNNITTRMLATMLDLPSPGEPGGPFG